MRVITKISTLVQHYEGCIHNCDSKFNSTLSDVNLWHCSRVLALASAIRAGVRRTTDGKLY